jgi:hypothetical protein
VNNNNRRHSGIFKPIIFVILEVLALFLILNILSTIFLEKADKITLIIMMIYFFISPLQRFLEKATRKSDTGFYNKTWR